MIVKSSNTTNRIEWTAAYFTASAENEAFQDVSIVTAKSTYLDLACNAAAELLLTQSIGPTNFKLYHADVLLYASHLMNQNKIFVQEHVSVTAEGISICVNAVNVDDEDVVWRALDLLADALRELDGARGIVYFGDILRFKSSEIPWVNTH